jgi:hypothetical protein
MRIKQWSFFLRPVFIGMLLTVLFLHFISAQAADKDQTPEDLKRQIDELNRRMNDLEDRMQNQSDIYKLHIRGFFDVYMSNYQKKPNIFQLGDFEIDLDHNYEDNFQVAAALVFNSKGANLGVGFIDYRLFGSTIATRGRLFKEEGLHLQVGKFDVPFGLDWQYYTAIERLTVTSPLTTDKILDGGYNDVGTRLIANLTWVNASFHVLRGIESGHTYKGNSFGGRIGFSPLNNPYSLSKPHPPLELGFSYLHDLNTNGATAERLWAVDFESGFGPLLLMGEYYYRDKLIGICYAGYQGTAGVDLRIIPVILYGRYDSYRRERYRAVNETGSLSRMTTGAWINISNVSYIKIEYSHYFKPRGTEREDEYFSPNLYYLQLMIRF